MSRIGKKPVALPSGVTATIDGSTMTVKGPKGSLSMPLMDDLVSYKVEDGQIAVQPITQAQRNRAALIEERQGDPIRCERIAPLEGKPRGVPQAAMVTLRIDAGRTDKLRPGDIVGALTGEAGLPKDAIGKIDVFPTRSYVAIARGEASHALERLRAGKIKGRNFRVRPLG